MFAAAGSTGVVFISVTRTSVRQPIKSRVFAVSGAPHATEAFESVEL